MLNKLKFFVFFVLVGSTLSAIEPQSCNKKHFLSVAAIFKDEAPYFKEWIEYHQLVGVDHFYLYNNGSTDDFIKVVSPYIQKGIVTLVDWPDGKVPLDCENVIYAWVACTQVPAYHDACQRSASETEWLAMIDIDEFMVPVSSLTMKDVLEKHREAPGIMLLWQIYGTSHEPSLPSCKLLIELLHMTSGPNHELHKKVKSIVKPGLFKEFCFPPHICVFTNGEEPVTLDKSEAQLNHYLNRTVDYFLLEKLPKKEHMDNYQLSSFEIEKMMNVGNDEEDTKRVIQRFVPKLRRQMGYDTSN